MYGQGLQYIRISSDRVVLKRGVAELLLTGPGVESIVEPLIGLLDGHHNREEIIANFPGPLQEEVGDLLTGLIHRRLIAETPEPALDEEGLDSLQTAFWRNFSQSPVDALSRLRKASILVFGDNLINRTLVKSLLNIRIGQVTLVDEPGLRNQLLSEQGAEPEETDPARCQRLASLPENGEMQKYSTIVASSDFGQVEGLFEINRMSLSLSKPYLPIWLAEHRGYVGPLCQPFETACLRCYRARADSNNPNHEVTNAVRKQLGKTGSSFASGFLPPMLCLLGEIAAIEVAKSVVGYLPCDTVARLIEVNMVSFQSTSRRVLKIPRCPDCSEITRLASRSIISGVQLPNLESKSLPR